MAAAEHRFYSTMSVVAAVVIVVGFGSTYVPKIVAGDVPVPAIVHLHAAVFTSWLLLFALQTGLVMAGRIKLHQQVGNAAMFLAGLMLVVGVMTAVSAARMGHRGIPGVEFPYAEGFLLLNIMATIVFSVLTAAGWFFRNTPRVHKRLMLMAVVGGLMPPGISRLPFVSGHTPAIGLLVVLFLLVGPVHDLITRRRIHPAYICGLVVAAFGIPPVVGAMSTLPAWHSIAVRLMQ